MQHDMGCAYVSLLRCCPLNLSGAIIHPSKTVNKPLISHYGYYRRILFNNHLYVYYGPMSYLNYWTLYTIPQYRCSIGLLHLTNILHTFITKTISGQEWKCCVLTLLGWDLGLGGHSRVHVLHQNHSFVNTSETHY
jgi:hypothetical protein